MPKKKTTEEFIVDARKIHGDKYDYTKFIYTGIKNETIIICPIHGEFSQTVDSHINNKCGCRKCGRIVSSDKQRFTSEKFIEDSTKIHGNKFDYSNVKYINNGTKLEIICKKHGSFWQLPSNHLYHKRGCKKCATEINVKNQTKTTKQFIKEANIAHKNKYDYSLTDYIGAFKKVIINCPKHGKFKQSPDNHLHGKECAKCTHIISNPETEFLDYFNIMDRQFKIKRYKIDGYDKNTNTIYEFLGDYYHGNLNIFNENEYNKKCKKTFGELHHNTFDRFSKIKSMGYNIKYIWESDWNRFKKAIDTVPKIFQY